MQSPSVVHVPAFASSNCSTGIPNQIFIRYIPPNQKPGSIPTTTLITASNFIKNFSSIHLLTPTTTFAKQQTQQENHKFTQNCPPVHHLLSLNSNDDPEFNETSEHRHQEQDPELTPKPRSNASPRIKKRRGIFTSMWWVDLKGAFGQRVNLEGIVCSVGVFFRSPQLALPHVSVQDVKYIDWGELKKRGFKGVVFDKDNTITAPYSLKLWSPIAPSIERCKSVFGQNIAVFSNSAGLMEYDHNGAKAKALEWAIGIKVIRHRVKKPAGDAKEIENQFGCDSSHLIMVGDRPFTDIVYGNRNGFFTILVKPLSLAEEPFIVRQVRKLETSLVNRWQSMGLKSPSHCLLQDASQCVRDPKSL